MRIGGAGVARVVDISLGQHGENVQVDGSGSSPSTVTLTTAASGSTFISLFGGDFGNTAAPSDSKSNTLTKLGTDQSYAGGLWPGFGLRAYYCANGTGGSNHSISYTKTVGNEEITTVFVEVIGGTSVTSAQGSAAAAGAGVGYSSPSISTSGAGLILAFWGGDADSATNPKDVAASAGWTIIESEFLSSTPYVQYAVAYRTVSSAGSYSLTWTPTANQGAAMFMVAVQ